MADREEIERLERAMAELKARWPAHSVPPAMWDEMEELENELERALAGTSEVGHAGEDGSGRLPHV